MEQGNNVSPRTYIIRRNLHLGYGFVAGSEAPTIVKSVEPNGPSYGRLRQGDLIMAVNGINVENAPREQIIKMITKCQDQIEITVRQPTYEDVIHAKTMYTLSKSSTNINSTTPNHFGIRQPPPLPPNPSPLNRLVTSISHQHPAVAPNSPAFACSNETASPSQLKPPFNLSVLQPKQNNGTDHDNQNYTRTLGRNHKGYGRHSPVPQRCKSSMDGVQDGKQSKKTADTDNDQPLLKRSNTMRPIRPPPEVVGTLRWVIKIFCENGHKTVLPYNQETTVGTILETLNARLTGSSPHSEEIKRYFGLVLTLAVDGEGVPKEQLPKRNQLHVLAENDPIMGLRHLPYWKSLRFLYRMVHPPADVGRLYTQSKVAFEYLYQQSCNDLRLESFDPELDHDTALKLGALHLLEYVHSNYSKKHGNSKDPKVYIKLVKKTPGIRYFLPASLAETTGDEKVRKIVRNRLTEQLRKNFEEFDLEPPRAKSTTNLNRYSSTSFHELSLPEMQSSPSDYIKLLFLNYLSQLPCYGNSKRPVRASASPPGQNSAGECSSSLESVPQTSDSSPLIKQNRNQSSCQGNGIGRIESSNANNITRIAQMNSMRSLSSVQSSSISQPVDQPDMIQTPSIESISSITFNMQNSPSPQQAPIYLSQIGDTYPSLNENQPAMATMEPSPMPRQQIVPSKIAKDYNSIEKLYNQRYTFNEKPIEELLKKAVLLPPPPPLSLFDEMLRHVPSKCDDFRSMNQLTQILTERDLEKLKVPPPPRMFN